MDEWTVGIGLVRTYVLRYVYGHWIWSIYVPANTVQTFNMARPWYYNFSWCISSMYYRAINYVKFVSLTIDVAVQLTYRLYRLLFFFLPRPVDVFP